MRLWLAAAVQLLQAEDRVSTLLLGWRVFGMRASLLIPLELAFSASCEHGSLQHYRAVGPRVPDRLNRGELILGAYLSPHAQEHCRELVSAIVSLDFARPTTGFEVRTMRLCKDSRNFLCRLTDFGRIYCLPIALHDVVISRGISCRGLRFVAETDDGYLEH